MQYKASIDGAPDPSRKYPEHLYSSKTKAAYGGCAILKSKYCVENEFSEMTQVTEQKEQIQEESSSNRGQATENARSSRTIPVLGMTWR